MAQIVYILCGVTSLACAVALLRSYFQSRTHLLLWSSFCFIGLALNNLTLFIDLVLVPTLNLYVIRLLPALVGLALLLYGLIWESE